MMGVGKPNISKEICADSWRQQVNTKREEGMHQIEGNPGISNGYVQNRETSVDVQWAAWHSRCTSTQYTKKFPKHDVGYGS